MDHREPTHADALALRTVNEIVTADPGTLPVLARHGIDTCCGGHRPLTEVCARHGLDLDTLVAELSAAAP